MGPRSVIFSEPWPVFFQRLELAVGLLRTYGGPKLLGPLVTNSSTYQSGGYQDDFGVLVLVLLAKLGAQQELSFSLLCESLPSEPMLWSAACT